MSLCLWGASGSGKEPTSYTFKTSYSSLNFLIAICLVLGCPDVLLCQWLDKRFPMLRFDLVHCAKILSDLRGSCHPPGEHIDTQLQTAQGAHSQTCLPSQRLQIAWGLHSRFSPTPTSLVSAPCPLQLTTIKSTGGRNSPRATPL